MESCWDSPARAVELSLPREGALLSFEQLRPLTPGALHDLPPIRKPRDAIYYHNNVGFEFCLPGDGVFAQSREDSWRHPGSLNPQNFGSARRFWR